jgi:hypothetical protein
MKMNGRGGCAAAVFYVGWKIAGIDWELSRRIFARIDF